MRTMKPIRYLLLLLMTLSAHMVRGQVSVVQQLDSMEMLIGEQVHLTISATVPEGKKVIFPQLKAGGLLVPGIEVLEVSATDSQKIESNLLQLSRRYTLTSFDDTLYYIPAQPVIVDGKRHAGKELTLKVLTVEVDTANKDSMLIPFGVQTTPASFREWLPVILAAFLAVAFGILAFYFRRRLKDNKPILRQLRFVRHLPPHQKATKAIHRLQQHSRKQDDVKDYYTALTDILRKYLGDQQKFDAMEMTTDDILAHLSQSEIGAHNEVLAPILKRADLVKFAKQTSTEDEVSQHTAAAIDYVARTKDNTVAIEEKQEQQYTTEEQRSIHVRHLLKAAIGLLVLGIITVSVYIVWKLTWLT